MKYVETKIVPLTMQLAMKTSTMPEFRGERPLKKMHVAFLRARYDNGTFYSPRWSYVTMHGVRYRINGQHSSAMLIELGDKFPTNLVAVMDEFTANEACDLAELFGQFDAVRSVRGRSQVITAHGRIHEDLDFVTSTSMGACVRGIWYGKTNGSRASASAEELARLLHVAGDFVAWANAYVKKPLVGRPECVVGVVFLT